MLHQTIQHTISQLLASARPGLRTAPMAVTKDGRVVPIGAAHADRFITELNGQAGGPSIGITGKVRHGYGNKAYGITVNWLGRCAAVMRDAFGPTTTTEFGPAEISQPSRTAKT